MSEFFRTVFAIVGLHAASDGLIALSCFLIPLILIVLVRRRRDLPFRGAWILFGLFILASGITHLLGVVKLWNPVYRLDGIVKAFAALVSAGTAVLLTRILPKAVALPGPKQVLALNAELESKVRSRTAELEAANNKLAEFAATLDKAQIIVQKLDGTILFWNSGSELFYGWPREQALGRKSHELLETELPQPFEEIQAALLANGSWSGEFRQRCRDGSMIWVASYWALHRSANGEPTAVVKVNNDITELKHTSLELRDSESKARSLFENASQGILTVDRDGRIVDANAMTVKLFGYMRTDLIGATVEMLLPESMRGRHVGHRASYALQPHARPMGSGLNLVGRRRDGSEFPIEISLSYVAEHEGALSIAFISDITERKRDLEEREALVARLEAALAEKTVLLQEVHHRVKNNLAVVAGLLDMQSEAMENEKARISLAESQQRVSSMAMIHEYLYSNEKLDRVDFGQYVRQLADELQVTYALEAELVSVAVEAEEIELPVHLAIPCGLILNELLSNAFKYAYPNGQRGEVGVHFVRLEPGRLSLSCQDRGVGIPESFDWRKSPSLGLRIIQILTKQLDGELTLDRSGGGTRFDLRFDCKW